MENSKGITQYFGTNLAELLSCKILEVYKDFNKNDYITSISEKSDNLGYTQRIELHADHLHAFLPDDFNKASSILVSILGEENKKETGMFTEFYWIMPIGKFVEKYGLEHLEISIRAIEEITKRNTGEYAIRPFIRKYPEELLVVMKNWAESENFHLRRLASEGLRPKLPWSTKLDVFTDDPNPVFNILELLKEDEVMFVKKSVANHLTDWLKVNKEPTVKLLNKWKETDNKHTRWIIKRATRKISID
jgi:3-methyladenine DNA glycosylase AlkC